MTRSKTLYRCSFSFKVYSTLSVTLTVTICYLPIRHKGYYCLRHPFFFSILFYQFPTSHYVSHGKIFLIHPRCAFIPCKIVSELTSHTRFIYRGPSRSVRLRYIHVSVTYLRMNQSGGFSVPTTSLETLPFLPLHI